MALCGKTPQKPPALPVVAPHQCTRWAIKGCNFAHYPRLLIHGAGVYPQGCLLGIDIFRENFTI